MRVRQQQGEIQRLVLEFLQQRDAQLAQAGARIQNDNILAATDFDAGSVAAIADGACSRSGYRAADTPKLDARCRFDIRTLTQVMGKKKFKNCTPAAGEPTSPERRGKPAQNLINVGKSWKTMGIQGI
jgi:hypothetical protein